MWLFPQIMDSEVIRIMKSSVRRPSALKVFLCFLLTVAAIISVIPVGASSEGASAVLEEAAAESAALGASGSLSDPNAPLGRIVKSGTNLREGPGREYPSLASLNANTVVTLVSIPESKTSGHWYKVAYRQYAGYVEAPYIEVLSDGSQLVRLVKTSCHMRDKPSGTTLYEWEGAGSTLPLAGSKQESKGYTWYPVYSHNRILYVRGDCVELVQGSVTPTPAGPTAVPTPTATPSVSGYIQTVKPGCNLRATPGGKIIAQVPKNVQLAFTESQSIGKYIWYRVNYNKVDGYLRSDVVEIVSEHTPQPQPQPTGQPGPQPQGESNYVITVADKVNIRQKPTTKSTRLYQVTLGTVMEFVSSRIETGGEWYQIRIENRLAWVMAQYLHRMTQAEYETWQKSHTTPAPPVSSGYVKTTANVNFRSKPNGKRIGTIPQNKVLPYSGTPTVVSGVTWYNVSYSNKNGYVHGNFVILCDKDGNPIVGPTPTAQPAPTGEVANSQQEASYETLRLGSAGSAVENMVQELINQGFYEGPAISNFNSAVKLAVMGFQTHKNLKADGIAGSNTLHALYGTVPIGKGDRSNLTVNFYPAEKMDWFTSGIQSLLPKQSNFKVYDVKTGIVWWAHRWSGGNHIDAEPLTAADTARLCQIYGVSSAKQITEKTHWQRRPLLVTIGTRTFACSLYGVPHNTAGDTIPDNNFDGQLCIHFPGSRTHGSDREDEGHKEAIQYAWEHCPGGHK